MNIEVVGAQPRFTFHWPAGTEEYDAAVEVRVFRPGYADASALFVAYGYREAFGCIRRRILIFRSEANVLAEFVGVDNWAQDKRVATFLRRDGAKAYLRTNDPLPLRYSSFHSVRSQSVITGRYAPRCMAAVAHEADIPELVAVALAREQGRMANLTGASTDCPVTRRIDAGEQITRADHAQAIVQALLDFRSRQRTGDTFTGDEESDKFLRQNPFAFLMAASIDRGAPAESVWKIPFFLNEKLGHVDPRRLSRMTESEVETRLRQLDKKPRFPGQAARTILSLSRLVTDQYDGNAADVWQDREPEDVVNTLQGVWGVGLGIAHMTVRILIDEFGYRPSPPSLRKIDVKPDVHVIRVFYRTALTTAKSGRACVEASRRLHSEFPGQLDWPTWEIGRTWCHEHSSDCVDCPLCRVCARIGSLPQESEH